NLSLASVLMTWPSPRLAALSCVGLTGGEMPSSLLATGPGSATGSTAGCAWSMVSNGPGIIQEVGLQGLVPALDLPDGGRRVRLGQQLLDPGAAADPLEQHLGGAGACRTGR